MFKCVLKRAFFKGHIAFELPENSAARDGLRRVLEKCRDRHNDYVLVQVQTPKRPRSVGRFSQNSHIWGHIQQIAQETGNDLSDVEAAAKERALKRGYPYELNPITGTPHPASIASLDTEQAARLIEELHVLAGELGIVLEEGE